MDRELPSDVVVDVDVVADVAATVSEPRRDPPDSFVLHAPLELIARIALLPGVRAADRDAARTRIVDIATRLEAFGPAVEPPAPVAFDTDTQAAGRLVEAIDRGEADDADAAAAWLGTHVHPSRLAALVGDGVVARLAAAGHAPIFLAHWPGVSPRGGVTGTLLRPLARALAVGPDQRITWVDDARRSPGPVGAPSMFDALAAAPRLGPPPVGFVAPIMRRVDTDEVADVIGPAVRASAAGGAAAVQSAGADVLRAAAWSMLLEPGEHAPYLWSHCLTMPQAVLAIARTAQRPERHLAVAATHVAGFRSAYASGALIARFDEPPPGLPLAEAVDAGQRTAATAAWHTPPAGRAALVGHLVNRAAVHEDAHLVKYTLACLAAAAADPAADRVYLAAAASLHGWWARSA